MKGLRQMEELRQPGGFKAWVAGTFSPVFCVLKYFFVFTSLPTGVVEIFFVLFSGLVEFTSLLVEKPC